MAGEWALSQARSLPPHLALARASKSWRTDLLMWRARTGGGGSAAQGPLGPAKVTMELSTGFFVAETHLPIPFPSENSSA